MSLAELRSLFRLMSDDTRPPYLWSDDEIRAYLNAAESEAAERASLIYDDSSDVGSIAVVAGTKRYALTADIVRLDYAELDGLPLAVIDRHEVGPRALFMLPNDAGIELNFIPEADGALRLGMYRLPIAAMALDDDEPEIRSKHHHKLLDWALHLAYLKADSEARNDAKAASHEAIFTANFGERVDANVRRKQRERRRHVVRCNW